MKSGTHSFHRLKFLMQTFQFAAAAAGLLAWASPAGAHPGHSLTEASPAHLLTSPDHLLVLLLLAGALGVAAQFVHRRLPRRLLQFGAVVAVLGAAALCGMRP